MKTIKIIFFFVWLSTFWINTSFAGETEEITEEQWKSFFPFAASIEPLAGLKPNEKAYTVKSADGTVAGWVFRTDQMDPQIKGQVDQICAIVGFSTDGKVLGVNIIKHKETPSYFQKLTDSFFKQFEGHAADASLDKIDTVTGATRSSSAIVRDVSSAVKTLLQNPSVKEAMKPLDNAGK